MNMPEINIQSKHTQITIFIVMSLLLLLGNLSMNYLVSILLIFVLFTQYDSLHKNIKEKVLTKKSTVPIRYTHNITELLSKLKKYKKKHPEIYQQGMYYWVQFMKIIELLEDEELHHYNQYFENAHMYLQKSANHFQSLAVSSSERKYIDGLKFHDFANSKDMEYISKISKQLFNEGYQLLYNLSVRLNVKWKKNPHVFNKQIVLDHPLPHDRSSDSYDFYL